MESKFPTQDLRDVSSSNTLSIEQQLNELRTERERLQREQAVREQEGRLQLELQRQEELNELRRQVAELTQRARIGPAAPPTSFCPTPSPLTDNVDPADSASQVGTHAIYAAGPKRRRFRDPEPFKGKTLKEATIFISSLKVIFQIDPISYETEREKVLFASTWLAGEPRALWSYTTGAAPPLTYTFADFEAFVHDCVADSVNRRVDVGQSYEEARQKEGESVTTFAKYLTTLEDQFHESYTEAQRTRHLLNKLRPTLRDAITFEADVLLNRRDLVAMAQRLENAATGKGSARTWVDEPGRRDHRDARAAPTRQRKGRNGLQPRKMQSQNRRRQEPATPKPDFSPGICYTRGKMGHYSKECLSRPQSGGQALPQRKVGVGDSLTVDAQPCRQDRAGKGKGREKTRSST
jgi:hypothetical protein